MMKRILCILIAVILFLPALVACGPSIDDYEMQKTAYNGIIQQYTALLTAKQNGEELPMLDTAEMNQGEVAIAEALHAVVNACKNPENMAYAYKDMDGNGTPELLLLSSIIQMKAIFTLDRNTPVLLGYEHEGEEWYFDASGRVCLIAETISGTEEKQVDTAVTYCRVDGTELVSDTEFAVTYVVKNNHPESMEYFEVVDGTRQPIDKERYDALSEEFDLIFQSYGMEQKLKTPCMIFPLVELPDPRLPADFSSYDAIKATFKAMVTYMPEARTGFTSGKFDNYFTFDSDAEFQIYNQLFGLGIRYCPDKGTFSQTFFPEGGEKAYGYCETDINGDGEDELLLMTDDYSIFSIFTTVKGKVVPLEGYTDFALEWGLGNMDEDGRFYSIKEATDGLGRERAIFEITSDGKFTQTLHIKEVFMSENDGYFKFENGEQIRLTEEEYKALREEYDQFDSSRYGSGGESVRNCTGITFTPLFEAPSIDYIPTDYPWKTGYYGSQRLYLSQVSDESVTFEYNEEGYEENPRHLQDVTATLTDGKYVFEQDGVKGYLEFGFYKIWFVVESSEDDSPLPRAYLFDFYDNN